MKIQITGYTDRIFFHNEIILPGFFPYNRIKPIDFERIGSLNRSSMAF